MSYLRTFAPWIAYAVIPSAQWRWAALVALLVCLVEIGWYLRARRPADSMIIEIGSAVFFAAMTAVAFGAPDTPLHRYAPALASGVLAVIAWLSLAIRRPFTLGIAKLDTPRQFWDKLMFRRTNVIITLVWAAAFTVSAAVLVAVAAAADPAWLTVTVQIAGFVLPMAFTVRYVALIRARTARLAGAPDTAAPAR